MISEAGSIPVFICRMWIERKLPRQKDDESILTAPPNTTIGGSKMSEKVWKYYPDTCQLCCGDLEVYTDPETEEGWVNDGDKFRCKNCKCSGRAYVHDVDCVVMWMTTDENGNDLNH